VLLCLNPKAGGAATVLVPDVAAALRPIGNVTIIELDDGDGLSRAVDDLLKPDDVVAVVGGDGSVNHVVQALRSRLQDLRLAVIPAGTGNDLARTLRLSGEPHQVAQEIADGAERALDVGRASGGEVDRLFLNACSGGFPVEVDQAITEQMKERLGPLAFWVGGAMAAVKLRTWRVTVAGSEIEGCVAVGIGNGKTAGGGIELWPEADPGDGLLDVCALSHCSFPADARMALAAREGEHLDLEGVFYARAERIDIEADPELELNVDGEVVGLTTPASFEVAGSVRVLVPTSEHEEDVDSRP
jgi:diacylglycerol kinase (ATP)